MEQNNHTFEPIRGSTAVLIMKLFTVMFLIDTAYSLINIFAFDLQLLQQFHYQLVTILFIGHFFKNAFSIYLVLAIVLNWISRVYYLTDKHLIKREGIISIKEKIYDLKIIRSISVDQGLFGKLFNYGNITITTSASGGYNDEIYLSGISQPEKYREIFKHFLEITT